MHHTRSQLFLDNLMSRFNKYFHKKKQQFPSIKFNVAFVAFFPFVVKVSHRKTFGKTKTLMIKLKI